MGQETMTIDLELWTDIEKVYLEINEKDPDDAVEILENDDSYLYDIVLFIQQFKGGEITWLKKRYIYHKMLKTIRQDSDRREYIKKRFLNTFNPTEKKILEIIFDNDKKVTNKNLINDLLPTQKNIRKQLNLLAQQKPDLDIVKDPNRQLNKLIQDEIIFKHEMKEKGPKKIMDNWDVYRLNPKIITNDIWDYYQRYDKGRLFDSDSPDDL
jgi:hypothetical protein